jgi:hypothetical protein
MIRIKSENYFHASPDNLNCAQAVLKGFQHQFNLSESLIEEFKAYGGGRAPEGLCGAVFAADFLLAKQNRESIKFAFVQQVGSMYCKEIKANNKFTCSDCISIADELLAKKTEQ